VVITATDSQSPTILGTSQPFNVAAAGPGENRIYLPLILWRE